MLYISTIISIIEVLIVTLPVLFVVAFVTVAERKTMASMQRRLGPNIVGQFKQVQINSLKNIPSKKFDTSITLYSLHQVSLRKSNFILVRSYTASAKVQDNNKQTVAWLYENRKVPVKPFTENILYTYDNLLNPVSLNMFFKNLRIKGEGGVYMFTYKDDADIYYIGRTNNFKTRLSSHMESNLKDKFHMFARLVGWDKFTFSILEICSIDEQGEKENKYLQKYLPILNTIFKTNISDIKNYDSLYDNLKLLQSNLGINNKYKGVSVYQYICVKGRISNNYTNFTSISKLSQHLGVTRGTISVYLNTFVPFRDNLFLTYIIKEIDIAEKLVSDATQGLNLNHNVPVKVWMYFVRKDGTINISKHESIGAVCRILGAAHTHITNFHLDKWVKGGFKGNYLFTSELSEDNLEKLKDFSLLRKNRNLSIWAYNADNLDLITPEFTSAEKASEFFNVDYRSILAHMDTYKATNKNGKKILFFNCELSELEKKALGEKLKLSIHENTLLWIYKKVNGILVPVNNNTPSSAEKIQQDLHININSLRKYTDTDKSYKALYFYTRNLKK